MSRLKKIILILNVLGVAIIAVIISNFLLTDGTEDTNVLRIYNLRIWKETPIWKLALAVKYQNTSKIMQLAKIHPDWLNYRDPHYGATLLIWAVGVEKYQSVEMLLKCGANPNITTKAGETALFVASQYSHVDTQDKKDSKYVKLLLQYGANPNIYYLGGNPDDNMTEKDEGPLIRSIGCGIEKTKLLVEAGAEVNHQSASGITPVIRALWEGESCTKDDMEYAYYLIVDKKADITKPWINTAAYPPEKVSLAYFLRDWLCDLDSPEYKIKMEIVKEFKQQGVDYWKTRIPDDRLQQIKKIYPDSWKEYINKY